MFIAKNVAEDDAARTELVERTGRLAVPVILAVPPGTRSGAVLDCPHCAGLGLRARTDGAGWVATIAHRVSCPDCDRVLTLAEDVQPGDPIECGGRRYRLTFEYSTFAAEPDFEPPRSDEVQGTGR
jgi:hypothetical protein